MYKFFLFLIWAFPVQGVAQIQNLESKKVRDNLYKNDVSIISVPDFKKLNKQDLFVLDAREENEFNVSHLKNARYVGYFWFDMRTVYDIPHDATVVVYCSVGNRSHDIAKKLLKEGYSCVYSLSGGIFEWANQGNPIYKSNSVQTSEVHPYNNKWPHWLGQSAKN